MDHQTANIEALVASRLDGQPSADVRAIADHVRQRHRTAAAVLAYGSCLRGVSTAESLIDLYVLMEHEHDVSDSALSRLGARLVPPNVYYSEMTADARTLRCKYAVMTMRAFAGRMKPGIGNPYFWARFSQPAILVYAANDQSRAHVVHAVADAVTTMYRTALACAPAQSDPLDIWRRGFEETYRTELRPEAGSRAGDIVLANQEFYSAAAMHVGTPPALPVAWPWRRLEGKALSLARLLKAAFTFEGGASYAAWKIERHSGKKIVLSAWQQRHPVLAGLMLLPKLLWRGAIK